MYIKINAKNNTMTLCKLIFRNSNKNMLDFNWIYNRTNGFSYKLCECSDFSECKSRNITNNFENKTKYKINISKKYKDLFVNY